jgi:3-hydroxyacyl-CoA dehydrogenase
MTHYQSDIQPATHHARAGAQANLAGEPQPSLARRGKGTGQDRQAMASAFSAERGTEGDTGVAANETPPVRRVGILGATAIGMDMARSLLDADIPVTVFELSRESIDQATASVRSDCRHAFDAGELTSGQRDRRVALLAGTVNLHHLKDCDVIIDALGAGMEAREGVLRRLYEVARPGAILMTHTSNGGVDHVAALARRPDNVLGFHVSHGPNGTPAWEFVQGRATSGQALAIATGLVRNLCKPSESFHVRPQAEGQQ